MIIKRKGFTLIELLVVISIIALLLSILMPSLQKVKKQAKRVVCGSNVRQIGLALNIYSQSNNNKFPVDEDDMSHWMWDVSTSIIDSVIESGGTRDTFYCPSYTKFNGDDQWNFKADPVIYPKGGYRVTGYFWMIERGDDLRGDFDGDDNKSFIKNFLVRNGSSAELVTDATLCDTFDDYTLGNYLNRTSHLTNGNEPAGGNILFVDSHVEWRKYNDMEMRFQNNTNDPKQWW